MQKLHIFKLSTKWTGNTGNGTSDYRHYERSHTVQVENKADIFCSSDAAFRGDASKHNPEDFFLAALSSCHMLWYLHLCADAGIVVMDYSDKVSGVMIEVAEGGGHFKEVTLHPCVIVSDPSMIEKALSLHEEANRKCFIANSCNFIIRHEPVCYSK